VDWEDFNKSLKMKLDRVTNPTRICSQGDLDAACYQLTKGIQETIKDKVPATEIGIKSKQWWTKELTKLRQEANRKGQKASKYRDWPDHHSHKEWQEVNKTFQMIMESTKQQHWRDWLNKAEDPDIWTAHKYTSAPAGDGGKYRIPVLKADRDGQEYICYDTGLIISLLLTWPDTCLPTVCPSGSHVMPHVLFLLDHITTHL
jgi:hypothetical protein